MTINKIKIKQNNKVTKSYFVTFFGIMSVLLTQIHTVNKQMNEWKKIDKNATKVAKDYEKTKSKIKQVIVYFFNAQSFQ